MDLCIYCGIDTQKIVTSANTSICIECGNEKKTPYDLSKEPYDWTRVPCITSYSRKKRFAKLFDNTVNPNAETNDNLMLRYLMGVGLIRTVPELLRIIKKSNLRDKRYGSLHVFSKMFVQSYQKPTTPKNLLLLRKSILKRFEDYEFAHKRYGSGNFFSYRWLLAKLLKEFNLDRYLVFVKMLKCPIRCSYYETMFADLNIKLCGKITGDTL